MGDPRVPDVRSRLATLVDLAPELAAWADIGAGDLAWAKRMLVSGKAAQVLCVEKAPGAYARARERARHDGRLTVFHGDGFEPLQGARFDGAAMAGFGGRAMERVLRIGNGLVMLPDVLLLGPATEPELPVKRACALGYRVVRWAWAPEGSRLRLLVRLEKAHAQGERGAIVPGAGTGHSGAPWYRPWHPADPLTARAASQMRPRARHPGLPHPPDRTSSNENGGPS